jgi:hypothetical protein
LVHDFPVQRPRGKWLLSRAALSSAVAYTAVATFLTDRALLVSPLAPLPIGRLEVVGAIAAVTFAAGLALAVLRERSLSLLPGIAIQAVGLAAAILAAVLL